MFQIIQRTGVIATIIAHLQENCDKSSDGILELNCGNGDFAEVLHAEGFDKYHGVDASDDLIVSAKARIPKFKRRFHVADTMTPDALNHKSEQLICLDGKLPFDLIKQGQRIVLVTTGFKDYGDCCLALTKHFVPGAKTVQFEDHYLTIGVKS